MNQKPKVTRHSVTFTIVPANSTRPIGAWKVDDAIEIVRQLREARDIEPIGFYLTTAPGKVPVLRNVEDILKYLRSLGLDDLADDLEYKKRLIEENLDELPISLESAREFAAFVATESPPGSPNVTVDSYGYVGLEWTIPSPPASTSGAEVVTTERSDDHVWGKGDGVLALWFLPNGLVRTYGTSGPVGQGVERMRVNSILPPVHVMGEVKPFLSRLERM